MRIIDNIDEIKVDKNKIIAKSTSNLMYIKNIDINIKAVKLAFEYQTRARNITDWKNIIAARIKANPRNLPIINSYLFIGFDKIR